jgi:16S rRNA (cytosine967-C5)-methyltransferase
MRPGNHQITQSSDHKTAGTARSVAFEVLDRVERGMLADAALEEALGRAALMPRDRALAWELVYGVLRRRGTLDWRLDQVTARPFAELPKSVSNALRLAAYQVLYLDRIPASAAVNESVNLTKQKAAELGKDWSAFVNGVLRNLLRRPAPPWPDPRQEPIRALAIRYSCPVWLAERWLGRLGVARAEQLCRGTLEEPPLTLRVNRLVISRIRYRDVLAQAGLESRPTRFSPDGVIIESRIPVRDLPRFDDGAFYVEDEAAQLVPYALDPQPGDRILDACAAPGGKTTHLAALMKNQGELFAVDQSQTRVRRIEENCRRLGVRIVRTHLAASLRELPAPFDRILVDAPCSGTGVLRRHPEGKWQKTAARLPVHQNRQLAILEETGALLRPGGVLVYSTCSTEPEENEQVIDRFCERHPEFRHESAEAWMPATARSLLTAQGDLFTLTMLSCEATLEPADRLDGFFAARLRKVT